mgnify:CR=1 FL=1
MLIWLLSLSIQQFSNENCVELDRFSKTGECFLCSNSYILPKVHTCEVPKVEISNCLHYLNKETCKDCSHGFGLSENKKKCEGCKVESCARCDKGICTLCLHGKVYDEKSKKCVDDPEWSVKNCEILSGEICLECKPKFALLISTNQCYAEKPRTKGCHTLHCQDECRVCRPGFYMYRDGESFVCFVQTKILLTKFLGMMATLVLVAIILFICFKHQSKRRPKTSEDYYQQNSFISFG